MKKTRRRSIERNQGRPGRLSVPFHSQLSTKKTLFQSFSLRFLSSWLNICLIFSFVWIRNNQSKDLILTIVWRVVNPAIGGFAALVCCKLMWFSLLSDFLMLNRTISIQKSGKKRLILDPRHVNQFLYKKKFRYEDLRFIITLGLADRRAHASKCCSCVQLCSGGKICFCACMYSNRNVWRKVIRRIFCN